MSTSNSVNNLGFPNSDQVFTNQTTLGTPNTYNFELKGRASFRAVLSSSTGDANLSLSGSGVKGVIQSSNPEQITDGITQILDPGTYTLTISAPNAATYGLSMTAKVDSATNLCFGMTDSQTDSYEQSASIQTMCNS